MKPANFWRLDWVWAILAALFVWSCGIALNQMQSNNYFEVTAASFVQVKSLFIQSPPSYFNELIPTKNGMVMALPPFPILPTLIGCLLGLGELQTTRLGIGIVVGLMFLIMRYYGLSQLRALISSVVYMLTTPLLFFYVNPGYWFTAQVWAVVGAEIALLSLLKKNYILAGFGTMIALLSRLNLGFVIAAGMALYILSTRKIDNLIRYLVPVLAGVLIVLGWNYYRFESIWVLGYTLIPGVLAEPWYAKGIMHPSYILSNLKNFVLQWDINGQGLGIIWAQPYLLLVPWITSKQNWWIVLMGVAQFVLVLAHGWWGAYQFDFRFLMDCLWLFVPILMIPYKGWRQWAIWIMFGVSTILHLVLVSRFM